MRGFLLIIGSTFLCAVAVAQYAEQGGGEHVIQKSQCLSPAQYAAITAATSVNDLIENSYGIQVYPNPFATHLMITSNEVLMKPVFTIYDSKGAVVYRAAKQTVNQKQFQLSNLQLINGAYMIVVTENNKPVYRKMMTK